MIGSCHETLVHRRRVRRLAEHLHPLLPDAGLILDVGCGDGTLAALLGKEAANRRMMGAEILPRLECKIPVIPFDGKHLPFDSRSVPAVLLIDVAHHAEESHDFVAECGRVAKDFLVIKDHFAESAFDHSLLRLMDWIGNGPRGIPCPGHYWSQRQWRATWSQLGWRIDVLKSRLGLYPQPFDLIFGRHLHFIAKLRRTETGLPGEGRRPS